MDIWQQIYGHWINLSGDKFKEEVEQLINSDIDRDSFAQRCKYNVIFIYTMQAKLGNSLYENEERLKTNKGVL